MIKNILEIKRMEADTVKRRRKSKIRMKTPIL